EGKQHLIPAIRAAAKGGHYTAPEHSGIMASDRSPQRPNFTHREMEVMITWCTGASIPQVARRLNISQSSVRSYLARAQGRYADTGRYAGRKIHMLARLIEDEHLKTSDVGAPDGDL
ncbi:response regulator transcription factor, partial [Saccharothrix algeriensis]